MSIWWFTHWKIWKTYRKFICRTCRKKLSLMHWRSQKNHVIGMGSRWDNVNISHWIWIGGDQTQLVEEFAHFKDRQQIKVFIKIKYIRNDVSSTLQLIIVGILATVYNNTEPKQSNLIRIVAGIPLLQNYMEHFLSYHPVVFERIGQLLH